MKLQVPAAPGRWGCASRSGLLSKQAAELSVRGIPHLAKNERDVGHPVLWLGPKLDLGRDFDAHGAGGALDALYRGLDGDGVQVGHLLLGDLQDLGLAYFAYLVLVRGA